MPSKGCLRKKRESKPVFSRRNPSLVAELGPQWGSLISLGIESRKIKPRWHPRTGESPEEQLGLISSALERSEVSIESASRRAFGSENGYSSLKSQTVNPPVVDRRFYTSSCALQDRCLEVT